MKLIQLDKIKKPVLYLLKEMGLTRNSSKFNIPIFSILKTFLINSKCLKQPIPRF
jgi:hypothetical protein